MLWVSTGKVILKAPRTAAPSRAEPSRMLLRGTHESDAILQAHCTLFGLIEPCRIRNIILYRSRFVQRVVVVGSYQLCAPTERECLGTAWQALPSHSFGSKLDVAE
jgi:hypothetical protein